MNTFRPGVVFVGDLVASVQHADEAQLAVDDLEDVRADRGGDKGGSHEHDFTLSAAGGRISEVPASLIKPLAQPDMAAARTARERARASLFMFPPCGARCYCGN